LFVIFAVMSLFSVGRGLIPDRDFSFPSRPNRFGALSIPHSNAHWGFISLRVMQLEREAELTPLFIDEGEIPRCSDEDSPSNVSVTAEF
jgi:hypothetical protein